MTKGEVPDVVQQRGENKEFRLFRFNEGGKPFVVSEAF